MKKIPSLILLSVGLFLIAGTLYENVSHTVKILNQINTANFFSWLLGFVLDFITNPAGLLGLALSAISVWKLRQKPNPRASK